MDWLKKIDLYKEDFIKDLKDTIKIPSVENLDEATENAPFGKAVREALDHMLELGRKAGFEVRDYEGYAGTITYGQGEESVGVLGHLDIVPVGEGWSSDPYGCEIREGYVFGRGVSDDKGPTLAAFYAMKMLKDNNIMPNKKIILIVGCNEETGMACMEYYAKHGEVPTSGFTPDANFPVVYGEKGLLNFDLLSEERTIIKKLNAGERPNIVIGRASATLPKLGQKEIELFEFYLRSNALKGNISYGQDEDVLEIEGKYFHSAECYNGVNAALHLLNYIGSAFRDSLATVLYSLLSDWKGTGFGIEIEGGHMGFLTMNTGIVRIEHGKSKVTIDIRYPNEVSGSELIEQIKQTIAKRELNVSVHNVHNSKPLFVDPKSTLIQTLESSYRKYTNDYATPIQTIGGGTYARKFDNFVAFGAAFPGKDNAPFFIGGPHEKDEAVKLDDLYKAMAIYTQALEDLTK